MAELPPALPTVRPTPSAPLAGRARVTGPVSLPVPRMPGSDRNGIKSATDPLEKGPGSVDLAALARTAGQLGQALEKFTPAVDMGANAADTVAYMPEAVETAFKHLGKPSAKAGEQLASAVDRAQKAGRVLGAVGAAIAAKDLFNSVYPALDLPAAGEALANLALGLATVGEDMLKTPGANALLRTVGGVAGLVSSLFALARDIKDLRENGLSLSNGLGMLGAGLTAVGSALLLLPGFQGVAGALIMAGASFNLVRLVHDNWDTIKGKTEAAISRIGAWLSPAVRWITGPPDPAPAPTPA